MEEWRPVKGFEGAYEVSNEGRLRSLDRISGSKKYKGKIIADTKANGGYVISCLSFNGKTVRTRRHRIVAEAFIPNPEMKTDVNHINGDKSDNRVDNLEWATHRENTDHAWKTGLTKQPPKNDCRIVEQIYEGRIVAWYPSIKDAALINKIDPADICKCCAGKRKNAGSYSWRYKEDDAL